MIITEPLTKGPVTAAIHAVPAVAALGVVAFDTAVHDRWAAWVARGHVHDQRVRRTSVIWAAVIAVGGAIVAIMFAS